MALIAAVVAFIILDRGGLRAPTTPDQRHYSGAEARVVRVIDGDTIVVDLPDATEQSDVTRVRLWGIDTPEVARNGKPAEPWADDARAFAEKTLTGRIVKLIVEPHRVRDRYGRVLAHVELENGDIFAIEILEAGLAHADDRWPHRWVDWFETAERAARRERVGLWSD